MEERRRQGGRERRTKGRLGIEELPWRRGASARPMKTEQITNRSSPGGAGSVSMASRRFISVRTVVIILVTVSGGSALHILSQWLKASGPMDRRHGAMERLLRGEAVRL